MLTQQKYVPGTQFLKEPTKPAEAEIYKNGMEENGLRWQSELKETCLKSHIAQKECEPFSVQINV